MSLADPYRLEFGGTDYVALPDLGACEAEGITEVSSPGAYKAGAASTNVFITHGLTIAEGDLVVAFIHVNGTATMVDNNGAYPFTDLYADATADTSRVYIKTRIAGASEPATYSWTGGAAQTHVIGLRVFRGVDAADPWDVAPASGNKGTGTSGTTATAPTVSTGVNGSLAIAWFVTDNADGIARTYSGVTNGFGAELEAGGTARAQATYTKAIPSAGAVGATAATLSTSDDWYALLMALKPSASVRPVFTYAAWIDMPPHAGASTLIHEASSAADYPNVVLQARSNATSGFHFAIRDATDTQVNCQSPNDANTAGWHRVVATCDGTSMNLYLDGVLVAGPTAAPGGAVTTNYSTIGARRYGAGPSLDSYAIGGMVGAGIWPTCWTPAQVTSDYAAGYLWPVLPEPLPESHYMLRVGGGAARTDEITVSDYGTIQSSNAVYATARAGSGLVLLAPWYPVVGQSIASAVYYCWQMPLGFDTSEIPAAATVSAVTMYVRVGTDVSTTDFTLEARAYDFGEDVETTDFVPGASLSSYVLGASVSTAGISTSAYTALTSEAILPSQIVKGGESRFVLCSSRQTAGTTPTTAEYLGIYGVTHGGSYAPYIVVTYSMPTGEDVTVKIDAESLVYGSGMRGFGSLEAVAQLESCNDRVSNLLARGADVTLYDNGAECWEGQVIDLPFADPDEPEQEIICAGRWELARRHEGYSKCFVDSQPYEAWVELPVEIYGDYATLGTRNDAITIQTDGEVLINLPDGTAYKSDQGVAVGYWLQDGMDPGAAITRVTADYVCEPGSNHHVRLYTVADLWGGSQEPITALLNDITTSTHGKLDSDVSADNARGLILVFYSDNAATTTSDRYVQLRNLVIYAGTQAKRRVDEAVVEMLVTDTGIAASSTTTPVGSALDHLLVAPNTTLAGAVAEVESKHALPVLSGIWEAADLQVKPRDLTPPDPTRHYVLKAARDDFEWDVQYDAEAAVDYVKVVYELEPENECLQPGPTEDAWPDDWERSGSGNVYQWLSGANWYFRLKSNVDDYNPTAYYRHDLMVGPDITVVPGERYLLRGRWYLTNYTTNGTAQFGVAWYDAVGTLLSTDLALNTSTVQAEQWRERTFDAPATAAYARPKLAWNGRTSGVANYLQVRDVEFRPLTPAGTQLAVYRPSWPASFTSRLATIGAGRTTTSVAENMGDQYLEYNSNQASGQVPVRGSIHDVNGREWPLSHIRAWDWVECPEYIDADARGPFMITGCEVQGGVATLAIGGSDAYAYDPPEKAAAKTRYIGGRGVWRRVRRRVRGRWRMVRKYFTRAGRYEGEDPVYTPGTPPRRRRR